MKTNLVPFFQQKIAYLEGVLQLEERRRIEAEEEAKKARTDYELACLSWNPERKELEKLQRTIDTLNRKLVHEQNERKRASANDQRRLYAIRQGHETHDGTIALVDNEWFTFHARRCRHEKHEGYCYMELRPFLSLFDGARMIVVR